MWLLILAILAASVFLFEWLYERPVKNFKDKIPGPWPLPIVGNGHMALGDSAKFLQTATKLIGLYGERSRFYLFSTLYVIFVNPKDVEVIMKSTDVISKADVYNYLHPWLGQGLLTATGQRWRKHRKFLTPAFHFNILLNFLPIFERNEKILVKKLRLLADGAPVDVFPHIALATLDNISESAMGVSINAQLDSESLYVKAVKEISEITWTRMRHPLWRIHFLFDLLSPARGRQDAALATLHGFTLDVIRNRRQHLRDSGATIEEFNSEVGEKKRFAFLDLMLLSTLDGKNLPDDVIREEVDTFMFEGHDTTTSAISFTLYCVSQHQDVQERLHEEQRRIFRDSHDRTLTRSDLASMTYLEMVIKESLRLYPSVPFFARQVTEDTRILGLDLPKGAAVAVSVFHMQRSEKVFEDPLAFKPERFLPSNMSTRNPFSWMAFSAGPRNCIGQKFAMIEMKVTLSSIIRNFKLLPSEIEPVLCSDLILRSQNGVYVNFIPR